MTVPVEPPALSVQPAPPAADRSSAVAIVCAIGAVAVFAIQDAIIKLLVADYPTMQILGIRSVV
ncbi:MAG TPA: hypothetical protein QGG47_13430, partial [Acidobacteriota bacterium]|nr:hypothetical protein [Acidobacteriota bacterium]